MSTPIPMSRTDSAVSNREKNSFWTRPYKSAESLINAPLCCAETVVKSAYRILICTVRLWMRSSRIRHISSALSRNSTSEISSLSCRSVSNVRSVLMEWLLCSSLKTCAISPRTAWYRNVPAAFPIISCKTDSCCLRISAIVVSPDSASRVRVLLPIPHTSLKRSDCINWASSPGGTTNKPSGFDCPEAIFAMYLLEAAPTETRKPVCAKTEFFKSRAAVAVSPNIFSVPLMSRNASSTDSCCISGLKFLKIVIISFDFS